MTILISIVLFHFIFDLLTIFIVMTNRIELINATEGCLLNIFSVKNICLPTKLSLIHYIFIWSRPRVHLKYGIIVSNNKIVNFEECVGIERCSIKIISSWKKTRIIFFGKSVSKMKQSEYLMKTYCSIFLQVKKGKWKQDFHRYQEIFIRVVYCKLCMNF